MNATSPRKQSGEVPSCEEQPASLQASSPALGLLLTGLAGIDLALLAGGSTETEQVSPLPPSTVWPPAHEFKPDSKIVIDNIEYTFYLESYERDLMAPIGSRLMTRLDYRLTSSTGLSALLCIILNTDRKAVSMRLESSKYDKTEFQYSNEQHFKARVRSLVSESVDSMQLEWKFYSKLAGWVCNETVRHMSDEFRTTLGEYFEHNRKLKAEPEAKTDREMPRGLQPGYIHIW